MKRILTYGTFDLLHWGHIRLLKRARALGDYLIVGASTDSFVMEKGARRASFHSYDVRKSMLEAVRYVDLVIPEATWEQKLEDIYTFQVDAVVMGSNWEGSSAFESLRSHCEVIFVPRTEGVSTSKIRRDMLTEAVTFRAA